MSESHFIISSEGGHYGTKLMAQKLMAQMLEHYGTNVGTLWHKCGNIMAQFYRPGQLMAQMWEHYGTNVGTLWHSFIDLGNLWHKCGNIMAQFYRPGQRTARMGL